MRPFSLALSGGGILGAAHLGALDALFSAGLVPTAYAGTSAGGLVAGYLGAGGSLKRLIAYGATVSRRPLRYFSVNVHGLLDELLPEAGPLPTGLISPSAFIRDLVAVLGVDPVAPAPWTVPTALIALDVVAEEAVVFTAAAPLRAPSGRWRFATAAPLGAALTATMAAPGLFDGVRGDDFVLVDGGAADTLPSDWAYALAPGPVLAIDVAAGRRRPAAQIGIVDALTRSEQYLTSVVSRLRSRHLPVFTIAPDTTGFPFFAFKDFTTLVDRGRRAVEAELPAIRRFIGQSGS